MGDKVKFWNSPWRREETARRVAAGRLDDDTCRWFVAMVREKYQYADI